MSFATLRTFLPFFWPFFSVFESGLSDPYLAIVDFLLYAAW